MIKVLHVVSSLGGGGVENMLYNYYNCMDKDNIRFDFIVHGNNVGILEEELIKMNSNIYHVIPKKESFYKNYVQIKLIIKKGKYDIVEVHQNFSAFPALFAALVCGVKTRIVHAHGCIKNEKQTLLLKIYRFLNNIFATDLAACSNEAAIWLYGSDIKKEIKIINNAINAEKFTFNHNIRSTYRKKLEIKDDEVCLLQVGRFSPEKNHKFTIRVLEKLNNKKFKLFFAGEGEGEKEIRTLVSKAKLNEQVKFLGCIDYVAELMNAADVLLFPSIHEGLPLVTIEAQLCGLSIFASDTLSYEMNISNRIKYMSIEDVDEWIRELHGITLNYDRSFNGNDSYSVSIQADNYVNYFKELLEKNR